MFPFMMKKILKHVMMLALAVTLLCVPKMNSFAAQMEDTSSNPLAFEIAIFEFEVVEEATQEDMPLGFTLADWEYNGVAVKAGFTENSDMVCVMGKNLENGNQYRFIYDPNHDMFVPYFGTEVKNGYVYTIPMYEDAKVPYGFVESYFVIQTVPMFTYMREDAELTQEEIAVGSLSEDNYLVFLMMDEMGREVHYTYDLVDRTFQRALLQLKDAEKVTELNETIDKLSEDIGTLNANNAERMNKRLTIIGVLVAALIVMAGVIVNLLMKINKLKKGGAVIEEEPDDEDDDEDFESSKGGLLGFLKKKEVAEEDDEDDDSEDYDSDEEAEDEEEEEIQSKPARMWFKRVEPKVVEEEDEEDIEDDHEDDDDLEILDLDLEDI